MMSLEAIIENMVSEQSAMNEHADALMTSLVEGVRTNDTERVSDVVRTAVEHVEQRGWKTPEEEGSTGTVDGSDREQDVDVTSQGAREE